MKDKFTYWDIEGSVGNTGAPVKNGWDNPETIKKLMSSMTSNNTAFHELHLPSDRGRGFNVRSHAVFDPIAERVPMASLCDLIYCLAHFDKQYFEIIDYEGSGNPFEAERFVGQFFGVDIRDPSDPGSRPGWASERRSISITVKLPSNARWNAFGCIDRMLETSPRTPGGSLRQFLYLLSKFGWFSGEHDFNIEATVKRRNRDRDRDLMAAWTSGYGGGGSYFENDARDEVWDLEQVTASVGSWQFVQYASIIRSTEASRMASLGYKDQIEIKKFGTKGMEQIHLYLNSNGDLQPTYIIHRRDELEGLIGGETWTEKELRLAEMMELRDEIFLDKPELFPILDGIQHLTPDRLKYLETQYYPRRREEILNRFGEGTIKFPKMEK